MSLIKTKSMQRKMFMRLIISIIFWMPLSHYSFSQIAREGKVQYNILGVKPTFKEINVFYQHNLLKKVSAFLEVGYEARYMKEYVRYSAFHLGVLPVLASSGFIAETGIIFHLKRTDFLISCQYKFNHIEKGEDVRWNLFDGVYENIYTRDDHKITLKTYWILNPEDRVQFYLGCGLRGVKSYQWEPELRRNYSANYTWQRYWAVPTLHVGIRIPVLKQQSAH
jgi:hypothetical protein